MTATRLVFGAITIFCSASRILAQDSDTTRLSTIVVSASAVPQPAAVLTQSVTVLKGEDLRARGLTRLTEALREVPGAMIVQSGSFGGATSLFLRGGESRYTKVLIDGVPINTSGGAVDLSNLTTDNIDRIEIVRGPASVLYGADAVSGIVQIFTRKASAEPRASIGARGGTYRSLDVDGDASVGNSLGGLSVGAAHHSTDGILPFNNEYRNGTLSSALSLARGGGGNATLSARYTSAEFHFPTDFAGRAVDTNSYSAEHRLTVAFDAGRTLSSYAQARLLAGSSQVYGLSEDIAIPFGTSVQQHSASRTRGNRANVEGRVSLFLPASASLTFGTSYERQKEHSSNASATVGHPLDETDSFSASRYDIGYYSEVLGSPRDWLSYTLSGRVDDNSDYARAATYRLGVGVGAVSQVRLRAFISTAFNAPAFSQLRPTLYTVGSPDLNPERSRSAEIGVTTGLNTSWLRLNANYFRQRFSDLIQYVDGGPPTFKGSYRNLTAADANGYEAELEILTAIGLNATASLTIVNPRVTAISPSYQGPDRVGDALIRRPTHSASLVVGYALPARATIGAALNVVGKRADLDFTQFPSPRVTLPAYAKLDLSGDFPLAASGGKGVTLTARIENVLNKRYQDVLNFGAPGRTVLVGARAGTLF